VYLTFDITPDGEVRDMDVKKSTNECFNSIARRALRNRVYAASVDGYSNFGALFTFRKKVTQRGEKCSAVFGKGDEVENGYAPNHAPGMICDLTPRFPVRCMRKMRGRESVTLMFDVSTSGEVENVRVSEATNRCFVDAAKEALYGSKYEPTVTGARNMETTVTFERAR
jgi:outer membrane biosynthesis protein TonB